MSAFAKGDKVRVTYEAVIAEVDPRRSSHVFLEGGEMCNPTDNYRCPAKYVELIEPVDDPSKDPIGTVRVHPRHDASLSSAHRRIRTTRTAFPWSTLSGDDADVDNSDSLDKHVTGWPKQSLADVARVFGHDETSNRLRVFRDDSKDLWFEIEPDSFTFEFTREAAEEKHEDEESFYARRSLEDLRKNFGPLEDVTHDHA